MESVLFELQCTKSYAFIKKSDSLIDIWKHIKNAINEPRNYIVNQLIHECDVQASVSAFYLIENFKYEDYLPSLISDINQS